MRDHLGEIIQIGILAADSRAIDDGNDWWKRTEADKTRILVEEAIRHLVDQGLISLIDEKELDCKFQEGIPVRRPKKGT